MTLNWCFCNFLCQSAFFLSHLYRWDSYHGVKFKSNPTTPYRIPPRRCLATTRPTPQPQKEQARAWPMRSCPVWPARSPSSPTSEYLRSPKSSCSSFCLRPTRSSWRSVAIGKPSGKAKVHSVTTLHAFAFWFFGLECTQAIEKKINSNCVAMKVHRVEPQRSNVLSAFGFFF